MKKLILITTTLLISAFLYAQEGVKGTYELKISNPSKTTVELTMEGVELNIKGTNDSKATIEVDGYTAPPEKAKGLRPVYNGYEDNTGVGLYIEEADGKIKIFSTSRSSRHSKFTLTLPQEVSLSISDVNWNGESWRIQNIRGEIELDSKNSNILVIDAYGPVVAHTTSGEMEIVFAELNPDKPSSINVVSSDVDITLPKNTKANLKMKSISGEIYTNFELEYEDKEGLRRMGGGNEIKSKINGGGVSLDLKSISGNVYLRKAE